MTGFGNVTRACGWGAKGGGEGRGEGRGGGRGEGAGRRAGEGAGEGRGKGGENTLTSFLSTEGHGEHLKPFLSAEGGRWFVREMGGG